VWEGVVTEYNKKKAYLEYELEKLERENAELVDALEKASVALDDWIHTYAYDLCDAAKVAESHERIFANHGTLYYIGTLQEVNRKLIEQHRNNYI